MLQPCSARVSSILAAQWSGSNDASALQSLLFAAQPSLSTCCAPRIKAILMPSLYSISGGRDEPRTNRRANFVNNCKSTIPRKFLWQLWLSESVEKSRVPTRISRSCSGLRWRMSIWAALTSDSKQPFSSILPVRSLFINEDCIMSGDPSGRTGNTSASTSSDFANSLCSRVTPALRTRCSAIHVSFHFGRSLHSRSLAAIGSVRNRLFT
mmetsp:Transcript_123014/g.244837  ORF Transcript_123014/g.244837 Transcript_123014/m.244837 type:complete len:210 (+) Transcript_123014:1224-1853(+)